ncbi:MAG: type II 3-dehydroquinate dehydratase [Culicoidibacterales bacterium]
MKIHVLNGPNLNMLGKRNPEYYGTMTLAELEQQLIDYGVNQDVSIECFQTNSEQACIEYIHKLHNQKNTGLIINAGAWTHYNYAIRDALEIVDCPKVEVHLSDITTREPFRNNSVIRDVVDSHFQGLNVQSYIQAIDYIKGVLQ